MMINVDPAKPYGDHVLLQWDPLNLQVWALGWSKMTQKTTGRQALNHRQPPRIQETFAIRALDGVNRLPILAVQGVGSTNIMKIGTQKSMEYME